MKATQLAVVGDVELHAAELGERAAFGSRKGRKGGRSRSSSFFLDAAVAAARRREEVRKKIEGFSGSPFFFFPFTLLKTSFFFWQVVNLFARPPPFGEPVRRRFWPGDTCTTSHPSSACGEKRCWVARARGRARASELGAGMPSIANSARSLSRDHRAESSAALLAPLETLIRDLCPYTCSLRRF